MIVLDVLRNRPTEMAFPERDHTIEATASCCRWSSQSATAVRSIRSDRASSTARESIPSTETQCLKIHGRAMRQYDLVNEPASGRIAAFNFDYWITRLSN